MTENEARNRAQHPRKNPHFRPPPGVQKALQNFGVPDLRQLLDRKHQEQSPEEQNSNRKAKLPPPDPEYNYLKDPARESPKEEGKKQEKKRQPTPKKNHPENSPKKELRFSDAVTSIENKGKKPVKEVLENPVNIKVKVSVETGVRSCELDENTIIPDIPHVPDQKSARGGFRGRFRGRGRGRGSFRGRGGYSKKPSSEESEPVNPDSNEGGEEVEVDNLTGQSITITSSNFQNGEICRDVVVNEENTPETQ